ncbi:hypothetical protein GC163_24295 [bacterium]|nr:hypothetical protein [bacterium]
MPDTRKRPSNGSKSTTGINFEAAVLSFLDTLRTDSPVFQRRSRSEVVNMIIEEFAANNGTPIGKAAEEERRQSA